MTKVLENNFEYHVLETAESESRENLNILVKELGSSILSIGIAAASLTSVFFNPFIIIGCALLICACRYNRKKDNNDVGKARTGLARRHGF